MPAGVSLRVVPTSAKIVVHPARIGIKTGLLVANITQNFAGGGAAVTYTHTQNSALTTWTINHNLGRAGVDVVIRNNAGETILCDMSEFDTNTIILTFNSAQTGKAYIA